MRARALFQVKVQGKVTKKRTLESCLCCRKEGHKKADCKHKSATCSKLRQILSLESGVSKHTNTHEVVKGADEPSPEGEMTADERITHERTGHPKYDPRCETCLKVRGVTTDPRKAVAEAAYFDYTTAKNSQQGAGSQDLGRCWTAWRDVCENRASQRRKLRRS